MTKLHSVPSFFIALLLAQPSPAQLDPSDTEICHRSGTDGDQMTPIGLGHPTWFGCVTFSSDDMSPKKLKVPGYFCSLAKANRLAMTTIPLCQLHAEVESGAKATPDQSVLSDVIFRRTTSEVGHWFTKAS